LCVPLSKEQQQTKKKLSELFHKIEKLEERYVQGEIDSVLFQKFSQKYQTEKVELEKLLPQIEINSSNLNQIVEKGLNIPENLSETWDLSRFDDKRKLQSLVFPEGILYNKQKDIIGTPRINSIFAPISILSGILKNNKKGHLHKSDQYSHLVDLCSRGSNFILSDLANIYSLLPNIQ
jgi:site-specific DNA recombinase